ncbi:DNA alkylation repair protein [Flavobacterium sp. MAH-1]|uniref:DNA alkylation repair protein n=1 Tax=Flavobacterium agri TaxID=2743471 RepID=A0A7Y9C5W9_9FLAO|nr:DNA alkylation repair protein [Flavobacterium agri]NUY79607.1 DNA alkylation repair protein [Flavobacterium agri]NYA69632.1 DNA alkylation repair protein [Flavobacterium agri]
MALSPKAENILSRIDDKTKLGDLRKIAAEIKKDHVLAMELWDSGTFLPRQLSILIMDNKLLSQESIDKLDRDIRTHPFDERNHLTDWLMANQLTKNKKTIELIQSWENSLSSLQRRVFWYYQGRLRWVGQVPPDDTENILSAIESKIENEAPEVQWAMNFTAGWIGVYDKKYRNRCVALGERTGLYKSKMVSKGCTPEYLPEFIAIESDKRKI